MVFLLEPLIAVYCLLQLARIDILLLVGGLSEKINR